MARHYVDANHGSASTLKVFPHPLGEGGEIVNCYSEQAKGFIHRTQLNQTA